MNIAGIAYIAGTAVIAGGAYVLSTPNVEMVTVESPHGIVAKIPAGTMGACEFDEINQAVPCVWDGGENGRGESYVALGQGDSQIIITISKNQARELMQ